MCVKNRLKILNRLWKNEKCQDPSGGIFLTHTVDGVYNVQYWACEQYRFWYSSDCKRSMTIYLAVLTEYCDVRQRGRWTTCMKVPPPLRLASFTLAYSAGTAASTTATTKEGLSACRKAIVLWSQSWWGWRRSRLRLLAILERSMASDWLSTTTWPTRASTARHWSSVCRRWCRALAWWSWDTGWHSFLWFLGPFACDFLFSVVEATQNLSEVNGGYSHVMNGKRRWLTHEPHTLLWFSLSYWSRKDPSFFCGLAKAKVSMV